MTNEEKQLLLRDICARLPYGVVCQLSNKDADISITEKLELGGLKHFIFGTMDVLPYLRPMSAMTEEERKDVEELIKSHKPSPDGIINNKGMDNLLFSVSSTSGYLIDWLNKKMFDYRGLIPMGLALEAPEGMYKNE